MDGWRASKQQMCSTVFQKQGGLYILVSQRPHTPSGMLAIWENKKRKEDGSACFASGVPPTCDVLDSCLATTGLWGRPMFMGSHM